MTYEQIDIALKNITLIVDTREHLTPKLNERIKEIGFSYVREKLNYGDYSAFVECDGNVISFSKEIVIERKMSLDELAMCFTSNRDRFKREFERAKEDNAKVYLLVENGNINGILNSQYRSRMSANAYIASLFSWQAKYDIQVVFCPSKYTGRVIKEILIREIKNRLTNKEI